MKLPFRREYFNEGPYVLPGKIFLDTLASITAAEDYDDENSTHPNIKKRKTAITNGIGDLNDTNRVDLFTLKRTLIMCKKFADIRDAKCIYTILSMKMLFIRLFYYNRRIVQVFI
jgi:hypothetical protein